MTKQAHDDGWGERVWAHHPGGHKPEDWDVPPFHLPQWDTPVLLRPHRPRQRPHHANVHRRPRVPFRPQRPSPQKVCTGNPHPSPPSNKWRPTGLFAEPAARFQPPPVVHNAVLQLWSHWDGWAVERLRDAPKPVVWVVQWDSSNLQTAVPRYFSFQAMSYDLP